MLTRAEAKEKICISKKETYPYSIEDNVDEVIDQIFDDHEAQLKAKDKEIERLREFEEMVEWMEQNSNSGLCAYYNTKG